MTWFRSFVVVLACMFASSIVSAQSPSPGTHFFPLGLWYEGGVGNVRDNVLPEDPAKAAPIYDKNFADIEAHGISVIVVPNSPPSHHKLVLDMAEKHHLKVILELGLDGGPFGHMIRGNQPMNDALIKKTLADVLGPIKDHPALLRVQLLDEPPGDTFHRYAHIAEMLKDFDPRMPPFCCLTGRTSGEAFLKTTRSNVVAFDAYPFGPSVKVGDPAPLHGFAGLCKQFAQQAAQYNADSWAVVQCHAITGQLRFPTDAELRCMTWSAIANGSKGVFWFLYQTERVGPHSIMSGLVDREFKPRPLWNEVARLTHELSPIASTLADLKPDPTNHTIVGGVDAHTFRDSAGKTYVIAVNFDALKPANVTIKPAGNAKAVIRLTGNQELKSSANGDATEFTDTLAPGDGAIYRVE